MGIWTIGREREKAHAIKYIKDESQHPLIFDVIDAVEDIKAGGRDFDRFIEVVRTAYTDGNYSVWDQTAGWIAKVGQYHPEVDIIWDELAKDTRWSVRFRVACVLYRAIPERQSHRIFDVMRTDRSAKVREMARDRYEWTTVTRDVVEENVDPRRETKVIKQRFSELTRSADDFSLEDAIALCDVEDADRAQRIRREKIKKRIANLWTKPSDGSAN